MGIPVPNKYKEQAGTTPGPVKTYRLTPEEVRQRYGPPGRRSVSSQVLDRIVKAVIEAGSIKAAAEALGTTEQRLIQKLTVSNIRPEWLTKEAKDVLEVPEFEKLDDDMPGGDDEQVQQDMKATEEAARAVAEKAPAPAEVVQAEPKSRLEKARALISKELYLECKDKKMSDEAIMRKYLGGIWNDVFYVLKSEWGLLGQGLRMPYKNRPEPPKDQEKPVTDTQADIPGEGIPLFDALRTRDCLVEDIASLQVILDFYDDDDRITGRITRILTEFRDEMVNRLKHVNEALERTVVSL